MRMNSEINIDNILSSIPVPTLVLHRTEDPTVSIQAGRFLAAHIPHAKLIELDGPDHIYWLGDNALQIADLVVNFITQPGTEARAAPGSRSVLATILFTDIVDSTSRASEMGDKAWFDGPARAIHCAQAITEAMAPLGIKVRAGLHTGEVERTEADVLGIAVHLAARIMDTASAGEVVISRTVKDLVAGSGIAFDDAGEHSLKGIEEKW
jgi:hypothetical protein